MDRKAVFALLFIVFSGTALVFHFTESEEKLEPIRNAFCENDPVPPMPRFKNVFPVEKSHPSFLTEIFERNAKPIYLNPNDPNIFGDIRVNYPIGPDIFIPGDGKGAEVKAMLNPKLMFPDGRCTVYAMGIGKDSGFEEKMTGFCNEVHAFDCTVANNSDVLVGKHFIFHPLCIGNTPAADDESMREAHIQGQFASLPQVMEDLNHPHIDIMKFDIEGAEWSLLQNHILLLPLKARPRQMMFELHTFCADPQAVPLTLGCGQNRRAVNRLFEALYDAGYRIISKEINQGDACCCEFVLALNQTF